ncbi:MAG: hypothetical protein ABSF26_06150 [Thermoguttaceae bacterium]|jgi:hypothetical protein
MSRDQQGTRRGGVGRWLAGVLCVAAAGGCLASAAWGQTDPPAAAPQAAAAEEGNPHLWKPQTRSVAVFKNGLGFFLREGPVQLRDGWCAARQVPPAAFGTLAIYARGDKETVDLVGSGPGEVVQFDGRDAAGDAAAKRARLETVKDLKVSLQYKRKDQERTAAGKLVSVGPEFVVLEDDASSLAVPLAGITRMQVLELPLRVHLAGDKEAPPARAVLGMAYLRKGITWIPDYTLKVVDEESAELTLRGTVVNEAEDLIHADVHLVVGVPHFVHTEYMAPLAVGQAIRTIGAAMAAHNVPSAVMSQQMMSRAAIVSNANAAPQLDNPGAVQPVERAGGDLGAALGNLPQLDGAAAADYTVYTKKDLTLRQGEKAIITLFVQKIKYSHIYRWSLPGEMEHALVLHNATPTPWTTGPCLALSGDEPLGEDLLHYAPKGGSVELTVTTAINVAHNTSEREADRKLKAYSPGSNIHFDLVTLEGSLKLRNFEKRQVEIIVADHVPGKPLAAEAQGVLAADPTKLRLLEREGTIHWRLKLEPGETKTVNYQYERYVPSN